MAEVDAPLVLLAPAVRTGQGCGSCPWAGGTNPMCESNVCAGGELPLGPRAAAAAWQPERCHLWQPEPSSGVGPAHVGAAEPRGLSPGPSRGRRQRGMSQLGRAGPRAGSGFTKSSRPQRRSLSVQCTRLHAPLRGRVVYRCPPPPETPSPAPTRQSSEHVSERARDHRAFPRKREVLSAVRTRGFSAVQSGEPNLYKMLGAGLWGNQRGSTDAPETRLGVWLDAFLSVACHRCLGLFWGLLMQKPKL